MADRWAGRGPSGGRSRRAAAITTSQSATDAALTAIFREETGRLTAALVRALGDFDLAEELVQEARLEAVEHWPKEGIPDKPGAWLLTTARRKAVDQFRRQARFKEKLALLEGASLKDDTAEGDDRLRLIFTCCHPALSREAQVALTLRAVAGLTTNEIARAFITSEATIALRRSGPYQLQAAIAACHAEAASWEETDWGQIVALYDALLELMPSPVVRLNRAIARRYIDGPAAALPEVDALRDALDDYYLFHATRAELL